MKNNKTLEAAGAAGVVAIFSAGFFICLSILQQTISFILSLPVTGMHH